MTGCYFLMMRYNLSIYVVITLFGLFVSGIMYLLKRLHEANQRKHDDVIHLEDSNAH